MRKVIIFLLAICLLQNASAQFKLEVTAFSEDTGDISARSRVVNDVNGEPTALLKIQIPMLQDAIVESPLKVKDGDYKPGEMLVYLGAGTKRVTIKHQDFEPLEYRFDHPLKGKSVYKLVLRIPSDYLSNGQVSTRISTNVNNASLDINGEIYTTQRGVFLVKLRVGEYPFTISSASSSFHPYQGTLTVTDDDIKNIGRIDKFFELQSDKNANLHIQAHQKSKITIDGKPISDWSKKAVTLPIGNHVLKVQLGDFNRTYRINLNEGENTLDADIRTVFTFRSPRNGELSITPVGNALKPAQSKIKAGQPIRLLGSYRMEAKCTGYDPKVVEMTFNAEDDSVFKSIPMLSNASKIYNGYGNKKSDWKKGIKEYMKLIEQNDDVAEWEYGRIQVGNSIESYRKEGERYIKKAADAGNPDACVYMAQNTTDSGMRRHYLAKAIKSGIDKAHIDLADSYFNDHPKDYAKAYQEYSIYKDESSRSKLGIAKIFLSRPINIEINDDVDALLKNIDKDDPLYLQALVCRGNLYQKGLGVEQDIRKATTLWKEAGIKNLNDEQLLILAALNTDDEYKYLKPVNLYAQKKDYMVYNGKSLISILTKVGQKIGNNKNGYQDSFRFFKKAYDLGDRSKETLLFLGKFYKDGLGTTKDSYIAKQLLNLVSSQYKDKNALRWLGNIYENEKDLNMACEYYLKAIEMGDVQSKGYYGAILVNRREREKGVRYLTEAANNNHKQSIRNLITYYQKVAPDASQASYWKNKLNALSK